MKKEPLHIKSRKTILEWIIGGKYKAGERLPVDRQLTEILKVSRITVLRALKELEEEGYLRREQGRGTYVESTKPKLRQDRLIKKKVKISFGINGYRENRYFYKYLANIFQQEHPETELEIISVPMSQRTNNFPYLTQIVSGNAPSTGEFFMHADYSALNGLVPLENMENYHEVVNNLHPRLRNRKTADAVNTFHIHALPVRYAPRVILGNVQFLSEAGIAPDNEPKTLNELAEWIQILSTFCRKQKEERYAFCLDYPTHCDAAISYYSYIWNHSGYKHANNKEEFVEMLNKSGNWLEYVCNLYQRNVSFRSMHGPEYFSIGKIALAMSDGPNIFRINDSLYPDFETKVFQIPPLIEGAPSLSTIGEMSVGIFRAGVKNEAELEASWRWIKFLLRPEIQSMIADHHWMFPASIKAKTPTFSNNNGDMLVRAMENAYFQYDFRGVRQALTILSREVLQAIEGSQSPGKALANAKVKTLELM